MKAKLIATLTCVLLCLAAPAMLQAQDNGAPDSLMFVLSPLEAGANDSLLTLELYCYNDGNVLVGISMAFGWDSEDIELISVVPSAAAFAAWNQFFLYDVNLAGSNLRNRAMFSAFGFLTDYLGVSDTRKLLGTFTFKVSNWDVNSSIHFDSTHWDDGSEMFFNDDQYEVYFPVWGWDFGGYTHRDANYVQCDPPIITCPTPAPVDICDPQYVSIFVPITGADNIDLTSNNETAFWQNDSVHVLISNSGTYNFQVTASVDCGEQTVCSFSVTVNMGDTPDIAFPSTIPTVNLCGAGTACTELVVVYANSVQTSLGTWSNNEICFPADTSGRYSIDVTATNNQGCGEESGTLMVDVIVGEAPLVDCPVEPIQTIICSPGQVCVDLPITGYDDVTVDGGAAWVDGLLCFNAPSSDLYTFNLSATNSCGTTLCEVEIEVTVEGTPALSCPAEPIQILLCEAGQACFPIGLDMLDVTISYGTFDGTNLCFQADTAGTYDIHIEATNDCGTETCDIVAVVEIGSAPVIACPAVPGEIFLQYPEQVCVPLVISGAANISVDGATWEAGQLCFQADTTGTYNFHVAASSDCGEAICDLSVVVDITPPCVEIVLSDSVLNFTAFEGDVTPSPESYTFTVNSTMDSVPFDFTITGIEEGMILSATEGTTPAEITLGYDVSNLPIGLNEATLTISSTGDRVCDPKMTTLAVVVEIFRQPSADTVIVADLPAVPGLQVTVPITFTNSCFLTDAQIELGWPSADIFLDSVSYEGSALADFTHNNSIDNDGGIVNLSESAMGVEPVSPASGNLWANLHFTVSVDAVPGVYPINLQSLQFTRNCLEGSETDVPEFIAGGILVDTTENYVCGWVVTPNAFGGYDEVEAAAVEMWSSYPLGEILNATTSGHNGAFAFDEFFASSFDLHAYAEGYYPGTITGVGFGEKGLMIVLQPVAELIPTDMWVDYYCESNTLLGQPLPNGSVVEAYDPQGTLCGRQVVTEPGVYRFMPVYRDSTLSELDEGATTGDIITFKVNGEEALATGDVIYPAAYTQVEVCLSAGATLTKTCDLTAGWNLVSWNLNTESDYVEDLLMDYMDCIDVVLGFERGGLTYDPDLPQFSTLWYMDHLSGYWVKVSEGCEITLELEGLPVLTSTPITVTAGWNLVSYLAEGTLAPIEALATIHDNLMIAYGAADGIQIYQPGQDQFNTLLEMNTCLGYWVKVGVDDELIYPSDGPIPPTPEINPLIAEAARLAPTDVTPTTSWMNLYSTELTVDGEKVQIGADISAYTMDNRKIGGFQVTNAGEFGFMPVYADDAGNQGVTGMKSGDKFYLTIDGVETEETFTWTTTGDRFEVKQLTSKGTFVGSLPDNYLLGQNYPNPFNPSTTISFSVPASSRAKIEIFNVLGKLVAVPFDGTANAGENSVTWDGKLTDGQTASSGVYFYRLSSNGFTDTKKMMLLK